jgi:hypothetical protein
MKNPMIRRIEAVEATIARFQGKPLKYGRDDCVRMSAFVLRKLGVKTPLLKAGTYSSEISARRAMKKMGFATLPEAVDAVGLPQIAPALALPGDILALKADHGDDVALAVAVGNGRALGFWEGAGVCTVFQPLAFETAWRSI